MPVPGATTADHAGHWRRGCHPPVTVSTQGAVLSMLEEGLPLEEELPTARRYEHTGCCAVCAELTARRASVQMFM